MEPDLNFPSTPASHSLRRIISQEQQDRIREIGRIVIGVTAVTITALVIYLLCVAWYDFGNKDDNLLYYSAALFANIATIISMRDICLHLLNWNYPHIQIYYIKIIFIVPVFSIFSWISLRWFEAEVYFEAIINAYEAFIINRYRQLLSELMGGKEATIQALGEKDPKYGKPKACFKCCCKEWEMVTLVLCLHQCFDFWQGS